jgi:hypothetical protein
VPFKDSDRHPRLEGWNKGDRQPAASFCSSYTFRTPFTASSLKGCDKGGIFGCILFRRMRIKIAINSSETAVRLRLVIEVSIHIIVLQLIQLGGTQSGEKNNRASRDSAGNGSITVCIARSDGRWNEVSDVW